MSTQVIKREQGFERLVPTVSPRLHQTRRPKVFIPYDGSECAEAALLDLKRAGLPANLEALVAVTPVILPLSPYEITRAVSERRMKLLTSGISSFAPALRDYEEQRVLSLEADRRIRSVFPSAIVRTDATLEMAAVAGEILRKAKSWGAELIVVGSKISPSSQVTDYAGPALRIAQNAHCSVRIARASDRRGDDPVQIVIAVDESHSMDQVVQAVANRFWPAGSKANLVAVHNNGVRDTARNSQTLEKFARELRAISLNVSVVVKHGQAQDVILREARQISADCIFINSQEEGVDRMNGLVRGGFNKIATAVALGAPCSVEVVRLNR